MLARFRRLYGASPLHLLTLIASLLITAAAVTRWFDNTGPITVRIIVWFAGAIIGHDLILLPLYSLLDRLAFGRGPRRDAGRAPDRGAWRVYVRVPALLSGLIFVVFFPEILKLGNQVFDVASGLHQDVYLTRYLLTCGTLFALSGLAYAQHLARMRRAIAQRPDATGPTAKP